MKRNLRIGLLLLASTVTSYTFGQEAVLASNETKTEETTPAADGKEEKEEPKLSISGSVDVYGRTTFGKTNALTGAYAPSTSFADSKGFGLGMANVILSYGGEKSGFTADLAFGPRGKAAVFGDSALLPSYASTGQKIINQMFVYYKLSDAVTLNLGQFNTFLGYEVISPAVNFHYSTSYLFSWGPFNHTGLRADFDLGNGLVAKAAIMNPTDIVEFNPVNSYTLGGQLGYTNDKGGVWLNLLYGDQDGTLDEDVDADGSFSGGNLFQFDITTGWNFGDKFYLGANLSSQSVSAGEFLLGGEVQDIDGDATSFFGIALYPKYTISDAFAIGARIENFSTSKGHLGDYIAQDTDGDGSVTSITLSGNYKVGGLTFIPEIRMDSASEDTFADPDGKLSKSLTSFTLAAVYKF